MARDVSRVDLPSTAGHLCDPGTISVAPFSFVKSVILQALLPQSMLDDFSYHAFAY